MEKDTKSPKVGQTNFELALHLESGHIAELVDPVVEKSYCEDLLFCNSFRRPWYASTTIQYWRSTSVFSQFFVSIVSIVALIAKYQNWMY